MVIVKTLKDSYGIWSYGKLHVMPKRNEARYRWAILQFQRNSFGTKVCFKITFFGRKIKVAGANFCIGTGIHSRFGGIEMIENKIAKICSDGDEWKVGVPLKWAVIRAVAEVMDNQ